MLRWFLFDTRAGDLLLAALERWAGLAVVDVRELAEPRMRVIGQTERVPTLTG